ncbi:MAG: asparagine synthase (glutamine-hydrolyzing) [Candidatus Kapabacteria bacterium]|nr:asparagine synthase (glutamine-hydrolyzing) [Candidatus Kapabacteria bacterium]
MCGIAGIIDPALSADVLVEVGSQMLRVTSHRGPDHSGTFSSPPVWLGHNRLSIIDLSSASHQPMSHANLTITFNGEVYNYVELRSELSAAGYHFDTTGDTEVVLKAFHHWGAEAVKKFIGMWAFAIWDAGERVMFCSRDRFGIKPFHYSYRDGRLYFASEIKALRGQPLDRGGLNEAQVARGLYLGWMHHWDETYFSDIKALPPSHNLEWRDGQIRIWQYADVTSGEISTNSFADNAAEFRELFIDSIRITSRRDVPMGVCLSGGLDSTSIAAVLASSTTEHEVRAFTAYYTGPGTVDERPYIKHLLDRYPQIISREISPTDNDVAAALDRIVHLMDAPMPSSSYISQYFVMGLAADHGVKVVLDGQGSDEILGGYMHSLYRVIAQHISRGSYLEAYRELNAHAKRQGYAASKRLNVLAKSLLAASRSEQQLYEAEFRHTYPWLMRQGASSYPLQLSGHDSNRLNAFLHNLLRVTLLPTLLHTEDINSMAFSIESRVPFLDHRLVDLSFQMPTEHKVYRGETKRVLRAAMRGIVPDAILDRKDKTGFITPGHIKWLRGALSYTLEGQWKELEPYVDLQRLSTMLDEYRRGDDRRALLIWRLAMLRLFLRSL